MGEYKIKPIDQLEFKDDYMFGAVLSNKEICIEILEIILDIKIRDVVYITKQKSIAPTYLSKSVRLDIFVDDADGSVYNVEMQNDHEISLPKRSRYYQSVIDTTLIERGDTYDELNKCFIIFFCSFDPFKQSYYKYTFNYLCMEKKDLLLGDETSKIFLNTKGTKGDINPRLKQLLEYIEHPQNSLSAPLFNKIETEVAKVRLDPERRLEYMMLEAKLQDMRKAGLKEGEAIGLEKGEAIGIEKGEAIGIEKGEAIGIEKGEAIGIEKGEAIGIEKGEAIGIEKGEAIGIQKGEAMAKRKLAINLLKTMTVDEVAQVMEMAVADVEEIAGKQE